MAAMHGRRRDGCIIERHDPTSAAAHGVEDGTGRAGERRRPHPALSIREGRTCGVDGEVRAAEECDFDPSIDQQRERDGVLFLPQEALGAVDWIERPEPWGVFLFAAAIDPVAGLLAASLDADRAQFLEHAIQERAVFRGGAFPILLRR